MDDGALATLPVSEQADSTDTDGQATIEDLPPHPRHWPRWLELIVGARERNVAPYRHTAQFMRELLLARCRGAGIDLERLGISGDETLREMVESQLEIGKMLPKREQFVLCDNATWGVETVAGRRVVPFPGPGRSFIGSPPDDATALAEVRRLHAEGARFVAFATQALWWLDYYESFARHLYENGECLVRNGRVALFKLAPPSPEPTSWRPLSRKDIAMRRAARGARMLFFTPAIHRLVPNDLALGLAAAAGSLLARHPELRRRAVVRSKVILAGTPLSGQEEVLAKRQIAEATLRAAVWMRPWYSRSRPIDGLDHLEAARRKGSGVLLVGAHIGMLSTTVHSLAGRGVRMALVAGRWILAHEDERSVQAEPTVVENVEWIYRGGAFEQMRAILDGGGVCAMSFDVPGGAKTTFLGKPSNVARGPANLAMLTGAPIVTAWADRRGLRPFVKLNPPIDPAGFASAEDLTQHLADVFSHELLRRPEALNADPTLAAVWSDVIGEDAGAFV